jgi:hypothetical protein
VNKQFGGAAALVFALHLPFRADAAPQATPAPAPVATPVGAGGLKITDCSLSYNDVSGVPGKFHVDFVNLNALPVTHVRFRVRTNTATFAVMDLGMFAPNVHVHHDLYPPVTRMPVIGGWTGGGLTGLDCTVDAYTLTNGYTWMSDALRLELQAQPAHR